MATLRFVLGDQLTRNVSALHDLDREHDIVLMAEVEDETTYVKHHKQKLVLVLSAMRHFAEALEAEGLTVDYVQLDDRGNTGSFTGELGRALKRHDVDQVIVTEPGEWRVWEMMQGWASEFDVRVEIRPDDRFLCSRDEFAEWAEGRKSLRMEYFYREMRKKTGWLMTTKGTPRGGQWNYDAENREALPDDVSLPKRRRFDPDKTTKEVMTLVERRFGDHFGDLDGFGWAVTQADARKALKHFVSTCLGRFGDYQDAMKAGEDLLFHAVLSPYLNIGLLTAVEVCEAALDAFDKDDAPLNAVEGFVRQILGWREFIRGVYWLHMPAYREQNFLGADRPLPGFYWTGETDMRCLHEAIDATRRNAYAHHIQRLMVTGNFALLAGLDPAAVQEWYLIVYADAFEWVELPNVHGMALHADGGILGSKPYAASGAYINRMSDYCEGCAYDPKQKEGAEACPFNYLYWDFLDRNRKALSKNTRLAMPYKTLDRMDKSRRSQIAADAKAFLNKLSTS